MEAEQSLRGLQAHSRAVTAASCVGIVLMLGALATAQTARTSSIQVQTAGPQFRNLYVLYYDANYLFAGRHYGDGRDFAGATEPAMLVHSKAKDRWLQITAISTVDGKFGASTADMLVSVGWDFTPYAKRPYIEQPLKTTGSLMFPDHIEYDEARGRYLLRHASKNKLPSAETVLYIVRADLDDAFAKVK